LPSEQRPKLRPRSLASLVASGFGSGYSPVAPGTAGSAVAALLGAGFLFLSPWVLALAAVAATLGGIWAIWAARVEGDPGWVVIDEFAGQFLALLALPRPSLAGVLAAFALFRLLDVAKPGPIGWADRQGGAWGIMADDVIAGAIAGAILCAVRWGWPGVLD
jgi:phosphatidylglycerophosphatase A